MDDGESIDQFDVPRADLISNIRKPSRLGILCGITSFLFLVSTITFIVLYAINNENPAPDDKTCSSAACIVSSSDILQKLDSSAKPCDDFYQFSCGGFLKNRYIRDEKITLSSFTTVGNDINHALNHLLEDKELMLNYSKDPDSAVYKAFSFYQSCMNESEIETTGIKPMLDVIIKYLNITNEMGIVSNDSWILERVLANAFVNLGTSAFIHVDVGQSFFDSSQIVVSVSAGNTGWDRLVLDKKHLSSRAEQWIQNFEREVVVISAQSADFCTSKCEIIPQLRDVISMTEGENQLAFIKEKIIKGYKKFMSTVFQLLGASPGKLLEQNVSKIFELEYSLGKLKRSLQEEAAKVGYKKTLKFMTLDELNTFTSFKFNWTVYFEEAVRGTNKSIPPNLKLLVELPDDIKKIIDVVYQHPKSLLADAIMWNVVRGLITTLPKSFREAENEFTKVKIGLETETPRWRICGDLTNTVFSYATALLFANKYFSEDARKRGAEVFLEIKQQFIDGLEEQKWMDKKTRVAARLKLLKMKQTIGYYPFIKLPGELNKFYKRIHVSPFDVFQNQLNIFKATFQDKIDLIGISANQARSSLSLIEVNAFYTPQSNSMTILMGILRNPFYDSDRLKALNYGSIGMIIGHEITHGFDVSGSQFDENGNLRIWWTKKSSRMFKERSLCLAEKYNKTMVFGRKVDGVKTLSENIADNGGLKYAFRAYRKWRDRNGEEDKLPGLAFNNDQLFFISYAQTWCTKYREQAIDLQMQDTHALHPVRVRVPLSNFPEFNKAFGCKPPNTTCAVW